MRVLKDSLKRSLVFLLVFTLAISGVDLSSIVYADDNSKPDIDCSLSLATTWYDLSKFDSTLSAYSMSFNYNYGIKSSDSLTVPVDFSNCDNLDDYIPSNIKSIRLSLGDLSVSCDNINSYITLGYYTISNFSNNFNSLFIKFLDDKTNLSSYDLNNLTSSGRKKVYNLIKSVKDDFLSADNEFKLVIEYSNSVSISTSLYLTILEYHHQPSSTCRVTSIENIVDYYRDVESGRPCDLFRSSVYIGECAELVVSLPTSKTIKNSNFYKDSDNAIFATVESDYYNTYYVDSESRYNINFPLDNMSYGADITNVKLGDSSIFKTSESISLVGGTDLNKDIESKDTLHISYNPKKSIGLDTVIDVNDKDSFVEVMKIFMESNNFSSIYYNNSVISLDNFNANSFSSISDFYNNAELLCSTNSAYYHGLNDSCDFSSFIRSNITGSIYSTIYIESEPENKNLEDLSLSADSTYYAGSLSNPKYGIYKSDNSGTLDSSSILDSFRFGTKYVKDVYTYDSYFSDYYTSELSRYYVPTDKLTSGTESVSEVLFKLPDYIYKDFSSKRSNLMYYFYTHMNETNEKGLRFYIPLNGAYFYLIDSTSDDLKSYSSTTDLYVFCPPESFSWFLDKLNEYYGFSFSDYNDFISYSYYGNSVFSTKCIHNKVDEISSLGSTSVLGDSWGYYQDSFGDYYLDLYKISLSPEDTVKCFSASMIEDKFYNNKDINLVYGYLESEGFVKRLYIHSAIGQDVNQLLTFKDLLDMKDFPIIPLNALKADHWYQMYDKTLGSSLSTLNSVSNCKGIDIKYTLGSTDWEIYKEYIDELVKALEKEGYVIDYTNSFIAEPVTDSSLVELDDFLSIQEYNTPIVLCSSSTDNVVYFGSYTNDVTSVYSSSDIGLKNNFTYTKSNMSFENNLCSISDLKNMATTNSLYNKGIKYPIIVQARVNNSLIRTVKNVPLVNGAIICDTDDFVNTSNVVTSYKTYSHFLSDDNIDKVQVVASYFDYKFGNLIFASRPSVVQDLAIDNKGNVTWNKSADEGLGVDNNGKSKSDDIVKLESYTLYVSDKDGNELYTTTATPSAVSVTSSAIQTPVVTKSAVSVKKLRGMSLSSSKSDALFTIPDEYNVAGNIITVYATNVLGDSDEVSITIPAKATPTPVPTATPTVKPTVTPTVKPTATPTVKPTATPTKRPSNPNPPVVVTTNTPEVTATPTVEPTSTPVPEYKLTVEDVYYDEDGTKEKSDERLTITVKEGEHYSYPSLDKDNYIARVSKFEGTVTSNVKLVFEYDKKKSKDLIVQGYVKKSDGTPVDNSLVEIVDEESKSDITDNTGFYRIEGVSEGEHDYTLYSGTTTGSSIVAKCKISVKDNNGEVKVTFKSEDSKIDTQTEEGVVRIDATLFDEEVTQSPAPTKAPTSEPTVEPTAIPSPVPTEVPTSEPTVEPTVIPTVVPTPVVTTRPAVTASPEPTVTPTPVVTTRPAVTTSPEPTVTPPSDMPTPLEPDEVETPKPTKKPIKNTDKVVGNSIFTPEPDNEVKEESVTLVQTGLYDNTKSVVGLILTSLGVCILFISLKKRNKK